MYLAAPTPKPKSTPMLLRWLYIPQCTWQINDNTRWTCGSLAVIKTGDAVWKTPWHPSTAESKDPSSSKSALNN